MLNFWSISHMLAKATNEHASKQTKWFTAKWWCKKHKSRRLLVGRKRVSAKSRASSPATDKREVKPPSNDLSSKNRRLARLTLPSCFSVEADLVIGFLSPGAGMATPSFNSAERGSTWGALACSSSLELDSREGATGGIIIGIIIPHDAAAAELLDCLRWLRPMMQQKRRSHVMQLDTLNAEITWNFEVVQIEQSNGN